MQDTTATDTPEPVTLNSLNGRPAPPIVTEGWKRIQAFSAETLSAFWALLAPVLLTPENASNQELINLFCRENSVSPDVLLTAVGCCEVLLKQAAANDLSPEAFGQDVAALSGGAGELSDFFTTRYPKAKSEFRKKILFETLSGHGKVMTGLQWRLDKVMHSSQGSRLDTDIVLLTLNYMESDRKGEITLQLTRDAAGELKHFCDHLLDFSKD